VGAVKFVSRIVAVPIVIIVVAFAIANRHLIEVSLDPLPFTVGLPLYLVVIGALALGFATGAGAAWLSGYGARRQARGTKVRIVALEAEVARLREARADATHQDRLPPTVNAA
jgi:putative membrane protein